MTTYTVSIFRTDAEGPYSIRADWEDEHGERRWLVLTDESGQPLTFATAADAFDFAQVWKQEQHA